MHSASNPSPTKSGGSGHGNVGGLVGRVIEDLNLKFVLRVIQGGDGIEEAIDHMHLVEDGKLNGDEGHFVGSEFAIRLWALFCRA
jgi:hypothetical protein